MSQTVEQTPRHDSLQHLPVPQSLTLGSKDKRVPALPQRARQAAASQLGLPPARQRQSETWRRSQVSPCSVEVGPGSPGRWLAKEIHFPQVDPEVQVPSAPFCLDHVSHRLGRDSTRAPDEAVCSQELPKQGSPSHGHIPPHCALWSNPCPNPEKYFLTPFPAVLNKALCQSSRPTLTCGNSKKSHRESLLHPALGSRPFSKHLVRCSSVLCCNAANSKGHTAAHQGVLLARTLRPEQQMCPDPITGLACDS